MINVKDVQTAIAKVLTDNNYIVTANEVLEGFAKPTFFVDIMQVSYELQNAYMENVTVGVDIRYIPKVETREECIDKSTILKNLFLYSSLEVVDRKISINAINFDIESKFLIATFEVEYLQDVELIEENENKMEVLNYGLTTDNN